MEIVCLGFQKNAHNQVVWMYKLVKDGKNYLVADNNGHVVTFLHNKKNEFDFKKFPKKFEKIIESQIQDVEKKKLNIGRDKDFWEAPLEYFPTYKVAPKKVIEPVIKNRTYVEEEINNLLDALRAHDVIYDSDGRFAEITEEMTKGKDGYLLKPLVGYKVKHTTDGDHKNDGQMVEYNFKFKSPKGKITELSTEMCLMVGWNESGKLVIE